MIFVLLFYVLFTFVFLYLQNGEFALIEHHAAHCYQLIFGFVFIVQFKVFTMILSTRYRVINKYLQNSIFWAKINVKSEQPNFKSIMSLHWRLTCILRDFNQTITSNISITLINTILHATLSMYCFIYVIYRGKDDGHENYPIVDGSWMCVIFLYLIVICQAGHSVKNSAGLLNEIIMDEIVHAKTQNVEKALRHLHFQVNNSPKTVKNNFVSVDWKLLLMVRFSIDTEVRTFY